MPILLTLIGPETFSMARSLAAPTPLNEIDYSKLIKLLPGYFCPKAKVIVQIYHFNKRNQGTEYLPIKLSENCEFIDLDDRLRDRLVCGLRNEYLEKFPMQELILGSTRTDYGENKERFKYSFVLVFVQCVVNTIFAKIMLHTLLKQGVDHTRHMYYASAAFSYLGAMVSSNMALQHVNFPTQ
ncbi:SLC35B1, partial [Cordylochernes scorpioides]